MKSITLNSGEYLLVETYKTSEYKVYSNQLCRFWNGFMQDAEELPPGNWQIIGKAIDLSEDDWDKVVDPGASARKLKRFKDYMSKSWAVYQKRTAKESGHSLIASHEMKGETTLILKKI